VTGTCGTLTTQELIEVCDVLSSQINGLRLLPWITALIGVLGATLAAYLTSRGTFRAQKAERFNKAQRDAYIAAQDVALELRASWLAHFQYVKGGRTKKDPFPGTAQARLIGKFDTALVRVDNEHLRDDYKDWHLYAQELFAGDEDLEEYVEEERWNQTIYCSGVYLRQLDK
jgi:hypothetical protein